MRAKAITWSRAAGRSKKETSQSPTADENLNESQAPIINARSENAWFTNPFETPRIMAGTRQQRIIMSIMFTLVFY